MVMIICCFQYVKDNRLKANHNPADLVLWNTQVVFSMSKIIDWKQITTCMIQKSLLWSCFQYVKDNRLKANHNTYEDLVTVAEVVFSMPKIIDWKQTTQQTEKHHSNTILNLVSPSAYVRREKVQLCFWRTSRMKIRPMPWPPRLVEKKGLNSFASVALSMPLPVSAISKQTGLCDVRM